MLARAHKGKRAMSNARRAKAVRAPLSVTPRKSRRQVSVTDPSSPAKASLMTWMYMQRRPRRAANPERGPLGTSARIKTAELGTRREAVLLFAGKLVLAVSRCLRCRFLRVRAFWGGPAPTSFRLPEAARPQRQKHHASSNAELCGKDPGRLSKRSPPLRTRGPSLSTSTSTSNKPAVPNRCWRCPGGLMGISIGCR